MPAGSVTFFDGATSLGTGTLNGSGTATLTTSSLAAGPHSITATFGENVVHAASTSPIVSQTILYPTTTSLVTNNNPAAFGTSVTLTATVMSGFGIPGGTVTFLDGVTNLGTGTLNGSGVATFSTSSLSIGTHSITASYGGDTSLAGSISAVVSQSVQPIVTGTALASSANPATLGTSVTFTATVTGASGTPAGNVTFFDGAATLGTGTLNGSGVATFVTGSLSVGSHAITASYGGNSNYAASPSPVVSQVIEPLTTLTTVASSTNPAVAGASITMTATVTSAFGTPGGNVTFFDQAVSIGSGMLNGSGVATFATTILASGNHAITAAYGGSTNHLASTSLVLSQTINPITTTTTLAASANPASLGASVTLTATVAGALGTPAGTVTFLDGAATLGSGTLNGSGVATFVTSSLTVGSHPLTAAYDPAGNHASSVSSVLPLEIQTLYDAWLHAAFTSAQLANPSLEATVWGPLADPDADGSTNLLEYAFGTDPTISGSVVRPTPGIDPTGRLTISFQRIGDPALFYQVSGSDGLATWAEVWSSTGAQNVAGSVIVTDTALPGVPSRFLVLRVSKP